MANIQLVTWKIVGIRPLIQSNPHIMWTAEAEDENEVTVSKPRKKKSAGSGVPKGEEAFGLCRKQLYINDDGLCYHPPMAFWLELNTACRKRKIGSSTAQSVTTVGVTVMQPEFILYDPDTLDKKKPRPFTPEDKWQLDYRRAVNHNKQKEMGGVGVTAIRPKWKTWGGFLKMEVDTDLFPGQTGLDVLTELLNIAGHNFGIGVGRIRMQAIVNRQEKWGGLGMGKFSAELM